MSEPREALDTHVVYVPVEATAAVLSAMFAAGAGAVGDYTECAFVSRGRGQFRPGPGARPVIGTVGDLAYVDEDRLEVVAPTTRRAEVVEAMRAAHPYEEPAFHVLAHSNPPFSRTTDG